MQKRPQHLHPRPVCRCPAGLPTTPPDDPGTTIPRVSNKLIGKPGLADSGFAADHEHQPAPAARCIEADAQLLDLFPAAHEDFARQPGIRARSPILADGGPVVHTRLLRQVKGGVMSQNRSLEFL